MRRRGREGISSFGENIHIVSYNPDDSMEDIYATVDLVILLSSFEGFGLPVLCSDIPVLVEVGGGGAMYVDRESPTSVTKAIRRFVEEPQYYAKMQRRSLENVSRFSWVKAARETLAVYQDSSL